MKTADPRELIGTFPYWLHTWPRRYGFALVAVAAATLVRYGLGVALGLLPPFTIFFPTILLVALLGGFGPGIFATLLSVASVAYFFWAPMNMLGVSRLREVVGLALFSGIGTALSGLAHLYRRHDERLREFKKVVEGVEQGIIVVDRDYRYVIANHAFLGYRCVEKEQLIGRSLSELMGAGVFEATVKQKLDECFRGKVVRYEKRYEYPALGERDFLVTYFPIEGPGGVDRVACVLQDITESKRAEEELHEREEKFHQLADNIQEIFWMVDAITKQAIYVNPAFEQITGRTVTSLEAPLSYREIIHGDDRAHVLSRLDEAGKTGVFDEEFRIVRPDGAIRWVAAQGFPVRDAHGEIYRLAGVVQDVTERRQAQEALRESEDRYRDLVEHSEDLLCTHDVEGKLLSVNPTPARILGYEAKELVKLPMREIIAPEYREQFDQYLARIKANGADQGLMAVLTRTGERRIWDYRNTLRTEGVPSPIVRGMAHDITDKVKLDRARKKAEEALRASEAHFRLLVEQASDGIGIADANGRWIDVNSAGAGILGYTREEFLQLRVGANVAAEDLPRVAEELARLQGGGTVRTEFKFRRKNGSFFPGEVTAKRLPDGRLQVMLRDITERRQAEEEMRRSEERFRVALTSSPVTVFQQDRDLRYTWIYNPPLHLGEEILGKTDAEIIGAGPAAPLDEVKRRVLKTGEGSRTEIAILHEDKKYYFDITLEPLLDQAGTVVGLTGASMDIARLRELADHLQEQKDKLVQEKLYLESEIQSELGFEEIIGRSPALKTVLKQARVVASTNATVLLLGETGTGKELVARSIHHLSTRRDGNFIKLNCAAVPSGLLESELFGHEKGAFTGAIGQKVGRIELADKGTLFLDEVGELPLELQPKLLRFLQDQEFERLGSVRTLRVDVRIIAATNRELLKRVAEKQFRQDLFYRLNVFPIRLPALRERRGDIPLLVTHFIRKHAARMNRHIESIPSETLHAFSKWDWPGNIRELENLIERLVILTRGTILHMPPAELDALRESMGGKRSA